MTGTAATSEGTTLNVERLIRIKAMCNEAANGVEGYAVNAYVDAANDLWSQLRSIVESDEALSREFSWTFQEPVPSYGGEIKTLKAIAIAELRYRLLGAWIRGLLEGQEVMGKVRAEAEAAAYVRLRSEQ